MLVSMRCMLLENEAERLFSLQYRPQKAFWQKQLVVVATE